MAEFPKPSEENAYLAAHVALLRKSFRHWTGRNLVDPRMTHEAAARFLYSATFAVVSHDTRKDPVFNYANELALGLFAMTWEEFTEMPSRKSAERVLQPERERLLAEVTAKGYVDDYRGIRIGRHGRRFEIEDGTVWNLRDDQGRYCGQAACFKHWRFL